MPARQCVRLPDTISDEGSEEGTGAGRRDLLSAGAVIRRGLVLRDAAYLQFRRVRERAGADSYHWGW